MASLTAQYPLTRQIIPKFRTFMNYDIIMVVLRNPDVSKPTQNKVLEQEY
jgi:hypothetical protein